MTGFTIGQANGVDSNVRFRAILSALVAGAAGTLKSRTGMLGNGLVVTRTSGMGLSVSAGRLWVAGTTDLQYGYPVIFDAPTAVTLDDGSSSARTDIVCVQVRDTAFDGSGATGPRIFVVKGSPGAAVPSTPTGAVKLAEQPVPANASAGTGGLAADPVDRRPPRTAMQGGIPCVVDRDDATANLALYDGLKVFRLDTGVYESRVGGQWVPDLRAVDLPADSGWVDAPLAAGSNYGNSYQTVQYRRIGTLVYLRGVWKSPASAQVAPVVCTLPDGFRPPAIHAQVTLVNANPLQLEVRPNGTVVANTGSVPAGAAVVIAATFGTT